MKTCRNCFWRYKDWCYAPGAEHQISGLDSPACGYWRKEVRITQIKLKKGVNTLLVFITAAIIIMASVSLAICGKIQGNQKNKYGVNISWESEISPFDLIEWKILSAQEVGENLLRVKVNNPDIEAKIKVANVLVKITPRGVLVIAYAYKIRGQTYIYVLKQTPSGLCYKQVQPEETEV